MKSKKKDVPTVSKIEVDENTAEPVIVEVKDSELPENYSKDTELDKLIAGEEDPPIPFSDVPAKKRHSIGKQMVMKKIVGYHDNGDAEIGKKQVLFKRLCTVVFILFVGVVLGITAYQDFFNSNKEPISFAQIVDILASNWYFLVFALLALAGVYFFKALKLTAMCKTMTGKFHFKTCLETSVVGVYYNNATPLAVGGQPFEIYHLSKHGVHGGCASAAPIAAFFLNQFAFVILGIVSLILYHYQVVAIPEAITGAPAMSGVNVLAIVGLVLCLLMPGLVLTFSFLPRVGAKLVHLVMTIGNKLHIVKKPKETTYKTIKSVAHNAKCLKKLTTRPVSLICNILFSFCEQLCNSSIAYFVLKFFGFNWSEFPLIEWIQVVHLCFILYAAISFIPTPGNSGAADLSFFLLFETGVAAGLAFPAMVLWRVLSFYSTLIIGFIFTTAKHKAEKRHELALQQESDANSSAPPPES